MWPKDDAWTVLDPYGVEEEARSHLRVAKEQAETAAAEKKRARQRALEDATRLNADLDDTMVASNSRAAELDRQLVFLVVGSIFTRHPDATLARTTPEHHLRSPGPVWYRLRFTVRKLDRTIYVTEDISDVDVQAFKDRYHGKHATVRCVNYQAHSTYESPSRRAESVLFRNVERTTQERDVQSLTTILCELLGALGDTSQLAIVAPAAAKGPKADTSKAAVDRRVDERQPVPVATNGRQQAPTPSTPSTTPDRDEQPPEVLVRDTERRDAEPPIQAAAQVAPWTGPYSEWDGFVVPRPIEWKQLIAEIEAEFRVTRADPSHHGTRALEHLGGNELYDRSEVSPGRGVDAVRMMHASVQQSINDPELLVAFARLYQFVLNDAILAAPLYQRADRVATADNHHAHWFWTRFLIATGQYNEQIVSEATRGVLPSYLRAAVMNLELRGIRPNDAELRSAIERYRPITGASTAEAVTFWQYLHPDGDDLPAPTVGRGPDDERTRRMALLGTARIVEFRSDVREALPYYAGASAIAGTPLSSLTLELTDIAYLRALDRAGDMELARDLWSRARGSPVYSSEAFRKQYLAFLLATRDEDGVLSALQDIQAIRAAT